MLSDVNLDWAVNGACAKESLITLYPVRSKSPVP